jgi:hypothetical protein
MIVNALRTERLQFLLDLLVDTHRLRDDQCTIDLLDGVPMRNIPFRGRNLGLDNSADRGGAMGPLWSGRFIKYFYASCP